MVPLGTPEAAKKSVLTLVLIHVSLLRVEKLATGPTTNWLTTSVTSSISRTSCPTICLSSSEATSPVNNTRWLKVIALTLDVPDGTAAAALLSA